MWCVTYRKTVLCTAAIAAALLTPAAADAAQCPKLVVDVDAPEAIVDYHAGAPEGGPLEGGKVRFPGHFYDATANVKLTIRGNTYRIAKGSTFKFSCYGRSVTDRNLKPALSLLRGKVDVKTSAHAPGGVITHEGLMDPRSDPTMTYQVRRTLTKRGELTQDDRLAWFGDMVSQPRGTTRVRARKGGPIVGVTPYVGPRPGSCRYCRKARLKSTGVDSKGYTKGSSTFSP